MALRGCDLLTLPGDLDVSGMRRLVATQHYGSSTPLTAQPAPDPAQTAAARKHAWRSICTDQSGLCILPRSQPMPSAAIAAV